MGLGSGRESLQVQANPGRCCRTTPPPRPLPLGWGWRADDSRKDTSRAPIPQRREWGTWDWPAKVDPVPRPHLHPRFGRGVASAPGPWLTAGYSAAKAGGEEENPGRGSQTKRGVGCALPSGLTSQEFLRDSVYSEARNKAGPNLTIRPPITPPTIMDILSFIKHLLYARLRFCLFSEISGLN